MGYRIINPLLVSTDSDNCRRTIKGLFENEGTNVALLNVNSACQATDSQLVPGARMGRAESCSCAIVGYRSQLFAGQW